jgi:Tudor domain
VYTDASAFRHVCLSENEAMDVRVISIDETNGIVVCQPLETKEELDKMHQHLQTVYSNDGL